MATLAGNLRDALDRAPGGVEWSGSGTLPEASGGEVEGFVVDVDARSDLVVIASAGEGVGAEIAPLYGAWVAW